MYSFYNTFMMQTSVIIGSYSLSQLIQADITLSLNPSAKILPSYMQGNHYSLLVSWMFETIEEAHEMEPQPETLFRAKQILDLFLQHQEQLATESYQLVGATAIKIAFKTVQNVEYLTESLTTATGGVYIVGEFSDMESKIRTVVTPHLHNLHSPYQYCSDELVAGFIPAKFVNLLPLMVAYVASHPLSFGINSLSIFLAILKHMGQFNGGSVPLAVLDSCPMVLMDCERIGEVLAELEAQSETD